jgi:hypothetical protein
VGGRPRDLIPLPCPPAEPPSSTAGTMQIFVKTLTGEGGLQAGGTRPRFWRLLAIPTPADQPLQPLPLGIRPSLSLVRVSPTVQARLSPSRWSRATRSRTSRPRFRTRRVSGRPAGPGAVAGGGSRRRHAQSGALAGAARRRQAPAQRLRVALVEWRRDWVLKSLSNRACPLVCCCLTPRPAPFEGLSVSVGHCSLPCRHPPRPAAPDLCRQAAGGRPHPGRLQHPEGEHAAPGAAPARRHADFCQDPHW